MNTVINNPGNGGDNGSNTGLVLGIIIAIVLIFVLIRWGLPAMRDGGSTTNINVEVPDGGDGGGAQ